MIDIQVKNLVKFFTIGENLLDGLSFDIQEGERVAIYHESMNKYLKITSYLKAEWRNVVFVQGTDKEYIDQICDYNENAEHDDCPDSLASLIRKLWNRNDTATSNYTPIFM